MVYNGADDRTVYATGWVLFDKNDPTKVLARSKKPISVWSRSGKRLGKYRTWCLSREWYAMATDGFSITAGADKYVGVASAHLIKSNASSGMKS
jgi:predicted GH43/DUF377 family glycosyl hydrolase